jgi:hypothetical protein
VARASVGAARHRAVAQAVRRCLLMLMLPR